MICWCGRIGRRCRDGPDTECASHLGYADIGKLVIGAQTNNRAEVLPIRAMLPVVQSDYSSRIQNHSGGQTLWTTCLSIGSRNGAWQWKRRCVAVIHGGDIFQLLQSRSRLLRSVHVYGHIGIEHKATADRLAKAEVQ